METNDPTGYSSTVEATLIVNHRKHSLAQVGYDFCVLRKPTIVDGHDGKILVTIDGKELCSFVTIVKVKDFDKGVLLIQPRARKSYKGKSKRLRDNLRIGRKHTPYRPRVTMTNNHTKRQLTLF